MLMPDIVFLSFTYNMRFDLEILNLNTTEW